MKAKHITLVDIYNKNTQNQNYRYTEHIHAKNQRSRDEVIKDSKAFTKAIDKYFNLYTR